MRSPNRSAVLKVYRKSFQEKWEYLRTELLPRKPETEPPPRGPFPPAHLFPSPENQDFVAVTLRRQTCSPKSTTQISHHRRNLPDGTSRPHGESLLSHRTPPLSSLPSPATDTREGPTGLLQRLSGILRLHRGRSTLSTVGQRWTQNESHK